MKAPRYSNCVLHIEPATEYESFIVSGKSGDSFKLDKPAVYLLELCDGNRSAREIINTVKAKFPTVSGDDIDKDVINGLTLLLKKELIVEEALPRHNRPGPLLVTGCARTGTSALANSLSTHPGFCIFNEYDLYGQAEKSCTIWERIRKMQKNQPPEIVSENLAKLQDDLKRELPIKTSNVSTRRWLFDRIGSEQVIVGDKMPLDYIIKMKQISALHEGVKFLITIRDGRAYMASCLRRTSKGEPFRYDSEDQLNSYVLKTQQWWLNATTRIVALRENSPAPYLLIPYEKYVRNPEQLAKDISDFVGIDYSKADFSGFIDSYQPVHVDSWRHELPDVDQHLTREFTEALHLLGYE